MDKISLGRRIRQLREKRGLSQDQVEKALGLAQKALTRIELGERQVSTIELTKLADLFHIRIADFLDKEKSNEDMLVVLHRIAPNLERTPGIQEGVARCIQICKEGVLLEQLLNISSKPRMISQISDPPSTSKIATKQGEDAAREERRRLGIGNSPILNIRQLILSQGIRCANTLLPIGMSGLFLHDSSIGTVILVNSKDPRSRRQFSYAHEYAHALFDSCRRILISESKEDHDQLIEVRANAFAIAFLMPEEGVAEEVRALGKGASSRTSKTIFNGSAERVFEIEDRQLAGTQKLSPQDVALIAYHFGVSYQAAIYRLCNLYYVSQEEREKLFAKESEGKSYLHMFDLDREKSEKQDGNRSQNELKADICRMVIDAYRQGKISRGRLLELSLLLQLPGENLLGYAGVS